MSQNRSRMREKPMSLRQTGKALRSALCSKKGYEIIDGHGVGWLDGGCWSLAEGIKRWLVEVDLYCAYDGDGNPQHVVVRVPARDIFIDGNGISSEATLIEAMRAEGIPKVSVAPFHWQNSVETPNGIELWKHTAAEVCSFLESRFGEGTRFLWRLCEAEDDLHQHKREVVGSNG